MDHRLAWQICNYNTRIVFIILTKVMRNGRNIFVGEKKNFGLICIGLFEDRLRLEKFKRKSLGVKV